MNTENKPSPPNKSDKKQEPSPVMHGETTGQRNKEASADSAVNKEDKRSIQDKEQESSTDTHGESTEQRNKEASADSAVNKEDKRSIQDKEQESSTDTHGESTEQRNKEASADSAVNKEDKRSIQDKEQESSSVTHGETTGQRNQKTLVNGAVNKEGKGSIQDQEEESSTTAHGETTGQRNEKDLVISAVNKDDKGSDQGDNTSKGALDSECRSSSQHWKRIYIKCLSNLPKRAFSNFAERYITNIEPIWMADEDLIQEGSLCISVCFNLSRLQDEIAAVIQVTPKGCTNMLVVIQNCREGMSPRPMLRSNPNDIFKDFTNILYDDGECYDCHINSLAREKVQAFIDNN
ncbi:uncharacterized protein LOC125676838 isoform X2 [Ostrea edulis]|uniref:uncharacterized protein LOC125676838 isoform X2 n=1 Tax=Ostrea edulis TaxID=37623 RepID=UPI0024AE8A3D|nr:uncharacterized protein LOC125676838 isoform X2 [Ostrea edulis]